MGREWARPEGTQLGTPLPVSPRPASVPLGVPSPRANAGCHAQPTLPGCGDTAGGTGQIWLPPALGMPVAILWERREQEGGKGLPGQPGTEPGRASQPCPGKISEVFCTRKLSTPATLGCSSVPPPSPNAPAIRGGAAAPPFPGRSRTKPLASRRQALATPCPVAGVPGLCGSGAAGSQREGAGKQGGRQSRGCLLL